jgi:chromosome partitioning protein
MDRVLAVTNHKGGVGKTTTAVNIAQAFAEAGKKVLLVDLDPQGSATMHLGIQDDGSGLLYAMQNAMALPVLSTGVEGLTLVPSGPVFAEVRQRFSGVLATELLFRCFSRTEGPCDLAIVDCPPSLDMLTLNALRVSRYVVIPIEANRLALASLRQTVETLTLARKDNRSLELLAIVVCRSHPKHRIHREMMSEIEKIFPGKVAPVVRENVALAEAPGLGVPVALHAPGSSGTADYRAVAQWLWAGLFS